MIHFNYDWNNTLNLIILGLVVLLLPIQSWLLLKSRPTMTTRMWLRVSLNILLWLALVAFILQPFSIRHHSSRTGIIFGNNLPSDFTRNLRDSLKTAEVLSLADLKEADNLGKLDTVLMVGKDFDKSTYSHIRRAEVIPVLKWLPYWNINQLQNLHWKGLLRKGEMQVIEGSIHLDAENNLKIMYGNVAIDSLRLLKGDNRFKFSFPAFAHGQTAIDLKLGAKTLEQIRFYGREMKPLTFQFVLDHPDFESRNLATWLGKQGHSVIFDTQLSKGMQSSESINKAKSPDVIVTDPSNAGHSVVKKAVSNGKSVLFINLTSPISEIQQINKWTGTGFGVHKSGGSESIKISQDLTALPFAFNLTSFQIPVDKYPVMVEKVKGNVGVSLLNETFPMLLSGDSLNYQKIWNSVFATIHPAGSSNIKVGGPITKGMETNLELNNFQHAIRFLQIGSDTVFLNRSSINTGTYTANFRPTETGWQSLPDSLDAEIFVQPQESEWNPAHIVDFIKANNDSKRSHITESKGEDVLTGIKRKPSDWFWLCVILICLSGIWVESKL